MPPKHTASQQAALAKAWRESDTKYLKPGQKKELATATKLSESQVAIYFKNQRSFKLSQTQKTETQKTNRNAAAVAKSHADDDGRLCWNCASRDHTAKDCPVPPEDVDQEARSAARGDEDKRHRPAAHCPQSGAGR